MNVEAPAAGQTLSGSVTVSGWAVDNIQVQTITIAVDGQAYGQAALTVARPDLVGPFPWAPLLSGFTGTIDTRKLVNGAHKITVTASDAAGNQQRQDVQVNVAN